MKIFTVMYFIFLVEVLLYASSQEDSYSLPLERGIFLASLDMRIFST